MSGTGARLLGGLSPLYKQDRKEGVSSGVLFCVLPLSVTLRSNVVEVIIQSGLGDDRVMSRT